MNHGALSSNGQVMSLSISQVAARLLMVTNQGLALHRKAPHRDAHHAQHHQQRSLPASPWATLTISASGERGVSAMAPR